MGEERRLTDVDAEEAVGGALDLIADDREALIVRSAPLVGGRGRPEREREAGGDRHDRGQP